MFAILGCDLHGVCPADGLVPLLWRQVDVELRDEDLRIDTFR